MARQRSVGVIASGVVAVFGSLATILMGISMFPTWIAMRSNPEVFRPPGNVPYAALDISSVVLVEGVFFLVLGVFGIVCAVALLRLKNWARISFLVFGGLLALFSIFGVFGIVVAMFVMPPIDVPPELPPNFMTIMFGVFLAIALMLTAVGIGWLIFFTRPGVRARFLGEAEAALPIRGPLSITIIAWILVVGGVSMSFGLFLSFPVIFFGVVFQGWLARLIMAAYTLVSLVAGVGMLRGRPAARSFAVGFYVFGLLNLAANVLVPGSIARMQTLMQQTAVANPGMAFYSNSIFWLGIVMGTLATCIPLWFLVTRRLAFLDACKSHVSPVVQS